MMSFGNEREQQMHMIGSERMSASHMCGGTRQVEYGDCEYE
jgi:hypothetical protein